MFSFYALINHVTGRKVFDLTREEKGAAAVDGLLPIVRVFYGADMYRLTGWAPSGPNYVLFSDVDRLADSLRDRSEVGWSPRPHAPILGALQRALDRKLWGIMVQSNRAQRTLLICIHRWKPPRMRCRRLHVYSSDPRRPRGDLRTTN